MSEGRANGGGAMEKALKPARPDKAGIIGSCPASYREELGVSQTDW